MMTYKTNQQWQAQRQRNLNRTLRQSARLHFLRSCVNWPPGDVDHLRTMIDDAIAITRETFLAHVSRRDLQELSDQMGYARHPKQGLTLAGDWAVSYHRSHLHGQTVYYMRHSAIEYVFADGDPQTHTRPETLNDWEDTGKQYQP